MTELKENTRLFVSLLSASLLVLFLLAVALSYLSRFGTILMIVASSLVFLGTLSLIALFLTLLRQHMIPGLEKPISIMIKFLYPLALRVGTLLGKDKDQVRRSFITVHNRLTKMKKMRVQPEQILVLLPHCLQFSDCEYKVTTDIRNCRRCGKCTLGSLRVLQERYRFHLSVAAGGTFARRIIKELRPKVVIAVACERDLASGIQDVEQIHVIGVMNERPFGPCFNTSVDLKELEQTIQNVIK